MKKIASLVSAVLVAFSMSSIVFAAQPVESEDIYQIEVALSDVADFTSRVSTSSHTANLDREFALSNTTGPLWSAGQTVDLTRVLPSTATVKKVTAYCPTSVKVTQSKYTTIDAFEIETPKHESSVRFFTTDTPSSKSSTTAFNGDSAATVWTITIQGNNRALYSGADGFTVNGGSKLIIEYTI